MFANICCHLLNEIRKQKSTTPITCEHPLARRNPRISVPSLQTRNTNEEDEVEEVKAKNRKANKKNNTPTITF